MSGLFSFIGRLFSEDARHNHNLYKSGKADKNEVRQTTIGWRPDPTNKEDGFTPDPGNSRWIEGKGYDTTSGNKEYYKVVRKK